MCFTLLMIIMTGSRPVVVAALSFLILCLFSQATSNASQYHKETLEIIIGGSGFFGHGSNPDPAPAPETESCEPPPPPPPVQVCPEPAPPPLPPPPPPSPPPPHQSPPPPKIYPPPPHQSPPPPKIYPPPPHQSPPPPKIYPPPPPSPPPPPKIYPPPPPSPPPPPKIHPPSPPPPPKIYPPPKISPRVVKASKVIRQFGKLIDIDPLGVKKTWKGDDACKYTGFRCDRIPDQDKQKAVSGVAFNGFGFGSNKGNLPLDGFINKLEDLAFFHANSNNFTGVVPVINLTKIRFLYELDLSNNKLTGEFPREVLTATQLTFLDLRFNSLTGIVPPAVFQLDIQAIFINNNKFSNELPSNLGSIPALYLTFANNKFTGQIPKSIGQLGDTLLEVLFINNKLSGCLPYEIGLLKKTTLFDARLNSLTGPIPQSFACLEKMEELNLSQNKLSGAIPESLCQLGLTGNLDILYLSQNYFTQVGPACRKLIEKKRLDIRMNCIYDLKNQRTEEECETFFKKEMTCPEEKWMNYIPCQKKWYRGDELSPVEGRRLESLPSSSFGNRRLDGVRSNSVTYGSLTPDSL